jgi:predicted  nucleic acid-binding Zn-ribbon protein
LTSAQLLLRYQEQVDRERELRESIATRESRLESDPAVVEREEALAAAQAALDAIAVQVRDSDRAREDHRARLRTREKELMSGRIRNPTDLMQMSEEVAHMKARFAEEEEAELRLMEEADSAEAAVRSARAELDAALKTSADEEPSLRAQLEEWRDELTEVERDKEGVWAQVPPRDQAVYSRIRVRPAVTRVANNQCSSCHVTVTSSGMQILRKGEALVQCENCGRILVPS